MTALKLNSPPNRKRERAHSIENAFETVGELAELIFRKHVSAKDDLQVTVNGEMALIGTRKEQPFILIHSDKKAEGAYGIVYKGKLYRDLTNLDEYTDVAIKVPHGEEVEEELKEFNWEMRVHELLPSIARVQKLLLTFKTGLVSELRTGTSLLIVNKPFDVKTKMFREIVLTLKEMMLHGFYYTDNKPENFLLNGNELEVVDLSAASRLRHVNASEWRHTLFENIFDFEEDELLLSLDMRYVHNDLYEKLVYAPKSTFSDYIAFKAKVESVMVYTLLVTYFQLVTNELPSECPTRAICAKNPIRSVAFSLLLDSGCPSGKAIDLDNLLKLNMPLTMDGLLGFLSP